MGFNVATNEFLMTHKNGSKRQKNYLNNITKISFFHVAKFGGFLMSQ